MHELARSGCAGWGQVFQPYVLGIAVLAVAVFAWGLGYKMSLYHHQEHRASQIPVAKLWVKPRGTSGVRVARLILKTHIDSGSQAWLDLSRRLPKLDRAAARTGAALARWSGNAEYFTPFRGPPQHRFVLA